LRQPCCQPIGKALRRESKARFHFAIGHWQRIVKLRGVGEIAHAKLVQPLQRADPAFSANHHLHQKLLRVHGISLSFVRTGQRLLSPVAVQKPVQASKVAKIAQGVFPVRNRLASALFLIPFAMVASPLCRAQAANSPVLQVEAWRKAVLAGESGALAAMYAESAKIIAPGKAPSNLKSELGYWNSWKGRGLKSLSAEVESQQEPQPGYHVLVVQLTLGVAENSGTKNTM